MRAIHATGLLVLGAILGAGGVSLWSSPGAAPDGKQAAPKPAITIPAQPRPAEPAATIAIALPPAPEANASPQTLAEILELSGDFAQTAALYQLAGQSRETRLQALIGEARRLTSVNDRDGALTVLYQRYAELNPRGMLADISRTGGSSTQRWLGILFHQWSRDELDDALAAIEGLDANARVAAVNALLQARDDLSPGELREYAQQFGLEQLADRHSVRQQAARATANPALAWQNALRASGPQRLQMLNAIANTWAQTNPRAALEAVESMPPSTNRDRLRQRVAARWASAAPEAALDWALSESHGVETTRTTIAAALGTMARGNPQEAWQRALGLDSQHRAAAMNSVLTSWARVDARAAAAQVANFANEPGGAQSVPFVAQALASVSPREAMEWAQTIGAPGAISSVINRIARNDPNLATDLVRQLPAGLQRSTGAAALIGQLSNSQPRAAAALIQELPDAQIQPHHYVSIAHRWYTMNQQEALEFVADLPAGAARDSGAVGLILNNDLPAQQAESLFEDIGTSEPQRQAAAALMNRFARAGDTPRAERYAELAGAGATGFATSSATLVDGDMIFHQAVPALSN